MSAAYLSIQQTADMLGLSKKTIYRCIEDGTLPAIRVRHQWRIKAEDLEPNAEHFKPRPSIRRVS